VSFLLPRPLLLGYVATALAACVCAAPVETAALPAPAIRHDAQGRLTAVASAPAAVVRYTLDGKDPTKDAGVLLAPVTLPSGYTFKARTFSADSATFGAVAAFAAPESGPRPPSTLVPVTQNRDWRTYDWAQRHSACVALMKERQPEIVMLGDSITHFWGGEPFTGRRNGPEVWDRVFAGRRVVNLGYGWDRTENVLWRLTHGEFENVRPKVVVTMIGTNNITLNTPDEIAAGVEAICAEIHHRSAATRILLLGIFPRGAKPDATRAKVADVNDRLAKLDGRLGVTYLDISAKFLAADGTIAKEIMYDFLHPTAKGYAIWAEAMQPTLQRLLDANAP
jgi:lysophospholipase L1-like esterase